MALKYLKNTVKLTLDKKKCIGCNRCVEVCPHGVFAVENKKAKIVDLDACMECGACKQNCPVKAIEVKAGVGCAAAILGSIFSKSAPECSCGTKSLSHKPLPALASTVLGTSRAPLSASRTRGLTTDGIGSKSGGCCG
jgi:NAD-dependent dihydropyrimidine dehydrogenase PreA subunit